MPLTPVTPSDADRLARRLGCRVPTPRGSARLAAAIAEAEPPKPSTSSGWDRPAPACVRCGWDHQAGAGCEAPSTPVADAAAIPEAVAEHTPRVAYWGAALMTIVVFGGLILYVGVSASRRGDAPLGYLAGLSLLAMGCGVLWAIHDEAATESQGGRRGGEASPLRPTADGATAHATHEASRPPALVHPRLLPPGGRRLDVVG